jgi:hypothetical protein
MTSALCKRKKCLKKGYDNAKQELKAAKDEEEKHKKTLGKVQLNVVPKIENIYRKITLKKLIIMEENSTARQWFI